MIAPHLTCASIFIWACAASAQAAPAHINIDMESDEQARCGSLPAIEADVFDDHIDISYRGPKKSYAFQPNGDFAAQVPIRTANGASYVLDVEGNIRSRRFSIYIPANRCRWRATLPYSYETRTATGAPAQILTACQQIVPYNLKVPGPDVPAEFRAYSGVWVGTWRTELCGALVVLSVEKDGSVQTRYAFGVSPYWGVRVPGNFSWRGRIENGSLKLPPNPKDVAEFRLLSPTQLEGQYHNPASGWSRGVFVKQ